MMRRILAALGAALLIFSPLAAAAQTPTAAPGVNIGNPTTCDSVASLCINLTNAAATVFSVSKTGNVVAAGTITLGSITLGGTGTSQGFRDTGSTLVFKANGSELFELDQSGGVDIKTGSPLRWYSAIPASTVLLTLTEDAAGVLRLDKDGTGAQPAVAGLSTCNSGAKGGRAMVTDATVAASTNFGAAVTGGGANTVPVYCDGTSWKIG